VAGVTCAWACAFVCACVCLACAGPPHHADPTSLISKKLSPAEIAYVHEERVSAAQRCTAGQTVTLPYLYAFDSTYTVEKFEADRAKAHADSMKGPYQGAAPVCLLPPFFLAHTRCAVPRWRRACVFAVCAWAGGAACMWAVARAGSVVLGRACISPRQLVSCSPSRAVAAAAAGVKASSGHH
jgi:hypothetical protein